MAKTPDEMAAVGREYSHQTALMAWAAMARGFGIKNANDPRSYNQPGFLKAQLAAVPLGAQAWQPVEALTWLHSIKNQGHGDKIRGANSRAEGLRAGVFDLFLPIVTSFDSPPTFDCNWIKTATKFYIAGLYIEMKTPERKREKNEGASDEQMTFQRHARSEGYAAELAHSWTEARDLLLRYLKLDIA